jgi:DNA-binding SARP family transcriptional activator
VLSILLLHANELITVDRLIDWLWSGEQPSSAVSPGRVVDGSLITGP